MSRAYDADVIIVGAGVAGAIVADGLARAGVKVLMLDSGPTQARGQAVTDYRANPVRVPEAAYPDVPYAPRAGTITPGDYYVQEGWGFRSNYERRVGGSTWHWLGTALRLMPVDFRMKSTFGVGADWPISYNDLEPWYGKAESELGVSGQDGPELGAPRSTPYPMPPIPFSYNDELFITGGERIGIKVNHTPQARNSVARDNRPACCGNSSCVPICPIGAKYDGTVHVAKAQKAGAQIIASAVVVDVQMADDGGTVTYRPSGGDPVTVHGRTIVLAANAIETPKLMLMSKSDRQPNGLGNENDQVGRYLMDHATSLTWGLAPKPSYPYRGPLSTSGIDAVRVGDFQRTRAAFRPEIHNDAWSWPKGDQTAQAAAWAKTEAIGAEGFAKFSQQLLRQVLIGSGIEMLPVATNRVTLSDRTDQIGVPRPAITFVLDDYTRRGWKSSINLHTRILRAMGVTDQESIPVDQWQGAGHNIGTTRMGTDPRTSVVNANLRLHGHRNCFVVGTGPMVTEGTANPTLTLAALSLRAVEPIRKSLTGA